MASTASAPSPTRSSATSSPASPSRTRRAPPRSPAAGARSGAPRRSSSSTPTSSREVEASVSLPLPRRVPTRRASSPPCLASSPRTRGHSAASTSSAASWARTRPSSSTGSGSSPPRASTTSSSSTAHGRQGASPGRHPPHLHPHPPLHRHVEVPRHGRPPHQHRLPQPPRARHLHRRHGEGGPRDRVLPGEIPRPGDPNIQGGNKQVLRLRLEHRSLRCVQICLSIVENLAVVDAPCLERLVLYASSSKDDFCVRVKIGHAPRLLLLGNLETGFHMLEIHDTFLSAGIRSSPSALFTSVKILGLNVNFGVRHDSQMLPNFLKCFPNAESLHIVCARCTEATSLVSSNFWDDAGPIESIVSHVNVLTFREFKGEANAISFLKHFVQNAQMLKNVAVVLANPQFTSYSIDTLWTAKILKSVKWASKFSSMQVYRSDDPEGGLIWSFQRGSDYAIRDPFVY